MIFRILITLLISVGVPAFAQVHDWTGPALPRVKINTVAFRGWIPETGKPLRGTLVLIPGRHGDGRGMAADPRWQALGSAVGFAVIGCRFSDGEPFLYQTDERGVVARAINEAVSHLATASQHPELAKAPLAFWGISAGSNVASWYCAHFPRRVAAFASSKGTAGPGEEMSMKRDIPMFFAIGAQDKPEWVEYSLRCVEKGLAQRAPWTLAYHPNEGHGVGKSLEAAIPFLQAAIELRLGPLSGPAMGAASTGFAPSSLARTAPAVNLKKINIADGWLGDRESFQIASSRDFKGKRSKAIWLPGETAAKAWQQYLQPAVP